jgi:oligopeptide/dipeptide ABC transporter ATP-binding protein
VTPLLDVRHLSVEARHGGRDVPVVDGVSFALGAGEMLGIVGESGSGKSVSVRSVLGLIPSPPLRVVGGTAEFEGRDLLRISDRERRAILGRRISIVFQDPLAALNPLMPVGEQIAEAIRAHSRLSSSSIDERVFELLSSVRIPNAAARARSYPHELSGGMRQRVLIAIALANDPTVLIADEPATALDVTIQAQIMRIFRDIRRTRGCAIILISHDLGLIAENCDRVQVMYAGRVVESGTIDEVLRDPHHPYTLGLMEARPDQGKARDRLTPIRGRPPIAGRIPTGCAFHPRCDLYRGRERCEREVPVLRGDEEAGRLAACHYFEEIARGPR